MRRDGQEAPKGPEIQSLAMVTQLAMTPVCAKRVSGTSFHCPPRHFRSFFTLALVGARRNERWKKRDFSFSKPEKHLKGFKNSLAGRTQQRVVYK